MASIIAENGDFSRANGDSLVHTGDYTVRFRRLAVSGDYSRQCGRGLRLHWRMATERLFPVPNCSMTVVHGSEQLT